MHWCIAPTLQETLRMSARRILSGGGTPFPAQRASLTPSLVIFAAST